MAPSRSAIYRDATTEDRPNAKKFLVAAVSRNDQIGSEFTKQLGTRRRRAQKSPAGPPCPSGALFCGWEVPRLGWRCLVQRNAGTARPNAYSGQSRHLVRECEIFSLMWHAPGRGSQSKQRNGGRRTDP